MRATPAVLALGLLSLLVLLGGAVLAKRWLDRRALQPDAVLVYKQVGPHALVMHLFRPPPAAGAGPRPALLLFHGGGWVHGQPSQFHPQCRHFSRLGLVCISAAYRLRSEHGSTPADALQDARDAMRHLRRSGADMGIDVGRIAAGGGSAGGHLAAALGTGVPLPDAGADPQAATRPDALLLYNPILDLAPGMPDHDRVGATWTWLSPRQHVGPGMPPTLVLSGGADPEVAVSTVEGFCQAVRQQGGHCELQIYPGAGHGFFNPDVGDRATVQASLRHATGFLARLGYLSHPVP